MRKKITALFLTLAVTAMAFSGCGNLNVKNTTSNASSNAQSETKGDTAKTTSDYKVAMICDSSIADGGWGAACYNAMVEAAKEYGFQTQYTDGLSTADFATSMRSYADMGFDLIFAPGNQYSNAVKEVAADYPKVDFALLNGTIETKNITSILPDADQIGYMAGALAGLMTKTNSVGFIGGMELDTTKAKLEKYEAAVKKVNPNAQVYSAYAGSFSDTAKGKEIAESMISLNDVDVFFGDASAVDSGAREVLGGYKDKFDIAQPSDLLATQSSDVVISSVVTDNAAMIKLCMKDVVDGTYGNKTIYGNLSNGCLSVGKFNTSVPQDIQDQYLKIVDQIKEGTFMK